MTPHPPALIGLREDSFTLPPNSYSREGPARSVLQQVDQSEDGAHREGHRGHPQVHH